MRSSRRLLAVTIDPSLHHEEQLGDDIKPQSGAEFLAVWGAAAREPELAYAIPQGVAAWLLTTRPSETRNVVEQSTIYSFGQGTASVHCDASLTTTGGHNFQVRLVGPPGLEIENLSLTEGGVQRIARWSTDDSGAITVFLTGPVSGQQQFSLEGRLPAPILGDVTLPGFQWLDAEVKRNQVEIFRQAATLVEMGTTTGLTPIETAAEKGVKSEWGRLVASYVQEEPQAALSVNLAPNQPETEARQTLIVDRDRDAWTATIDLELNVRHGLVDALRFDVPPQWTEPYRFDKDVQWELLPVPGENRRQLVIRPQAPISGEYSLRVSGALVATMGDRLGVADIILRGLHPVERFVVLPTKWDREHVDWETRGLVDARLPAELRKRLTLRPVVRVYRVLGEHYQATLKNIEHTPTRPRVRLADVHYVWQTDGDYYGVACFELSSATAATAVVKLPPGMTLVSLTVANLPTAVVPVAQGWQFALGAPQLPQQVDIVFRGTLAGSPASAASFRCEAPSLEGLDVDETLWTVYGPAGVGPGEAVDSDAISSAEQERARLEATKSILALAAHVAGEQTPEEMNRWRSLWSSRFLAARQRVGRLALAGGPSADHRELSAWTRDEADVAERLGVVAGAPAVAVRQIFGPLQLLTANVAADPGAVGCKFADRAAAVVVRYPYVPRGDLPWRVVAALLLALLAGVLIWKRPTGPAWRFSPPRLLAFVGAGWWLWLAPSVVGFAIMLGPLLVALTRRLRPAEPAPLATLPTL